MIRAGELANEPEVYGLARDVLNKYGWGDRRLYRAWGNAVESRVDSKN
jgi:hypothetical protein